MRNEIESKLRAFKDCCEEAPAGTYTRAKDLNDTIGETVDRLMRELRADGWKANNNDMAFTLEAQIYQYVKASNPDSDTFPVAEGFGSAMSLPCRDRVIAQAERDRDFIAKNVSLSAMGVL